MNRLTKLKSAFADGSNYKYLLLSILITGLSYGLYKGMLDNYLAEIVGMGEMDRGIAEFFREIPGILLVLILAAFYMFSAEAMYKAGALIMMVGMGMHAVLPPSKLLVVLAICMYSLGEHIQIGMKSTLTLSYARPGCGGAALGIQNSASQIGTLGGYLVIIAVFSLTAASGSYTILFAAAAVLAGISLACSMKITGSSETDRSKRRFYFHKSIQNTTCWRCSMVPASRCSLPSAPMC